MTPSIGIEAHEKLMGLLNKEGLTEKKLIRGVTALEKTHKNVIYSNLLAILSNLQFNEKSARKHWESIIAHKKELSSSIGRKIDFRVALLDYFLAKSKKMKNPIVVEIKIFQKTKKSSIIDELTGLYNYRYFLSALEKEKSRADRYHSPFSLIMLDVDDFKDFNDHNGHLAGNEALRRIARILKDNIRGVDILARYGGEEFAVILPETIKQGALTIAERIRKAVEKYRFSMQNGSSTRKLTVSGGVATYIVDAKTSKELLQKADSALYTAKSEGKNAVHLYLNERRAYARISTSCIGSYWILSSDYHTFQTKNISINGILFEADRSLPLSTVLEMKLNFPTTTRTIMCKTRVARTEETERGRYDIGVRILEMSRRDRKVFNSYLGTLQPS